MRDIKVHGLVNDRILYFRQPSLWRYLSIFLVCCFKPLAYISIVFATVTFKNAFMSRQSCSSNADGRSVITNWKLNDTGLWNNCYTFWFCSIYLKVDWIQDFFFFSCTISHTSCFHWNSNVSFLLSNLEAQIYL